MKKETVCSFEGTGRKQLETAAFYFFIGKFDISKGHNRKKSF